MSNETTALAQPRETKTQLDELRERLNISLLAAGAAGSWDWDIDHGLLYLDHRMAGLYGIEADAADSGLPTETFFEAIFPADVNRIRIAVAGMLHGAEVFLKTFRIIAADGMLRWVEAHGRCHLHPGGQPQRFSGILVDITGRRRVEERLRIAQSAGGVGTFEHVPGHATAVVSEQFCNLLGLNEASVLPVATINRLVKDGSPALLDMSKSPAEELPYTEISIARADNGEERWLALRGEGIRDVEGGGIRHVGVIYDITDSKRVQDALRQLNETLEQRVETEIGQRLETEEALRQAQKMEAVGQLTGGIAHDFNNLLTVILGNLDMALRRLGASGDERIERALVSAFKGADRAAALTQRLLAFSRRQPLAPKQVNVTRVLQGMADLLSRTLGETISLQTISPSEFWPVEVDPNQLENAILNLAVNARDAMTGNGTLTLTVTNVAAGSKLPSGAITPHECLQLSVSDTGSGMPEETIKRAFEPFFTTKEVGKGTGLGLSMVYGFVRQSGGDISITSRLGQGTTIYMYFPKTADHADAAEHSTLAATDRRSQDETILIAEDDEDVRQFAVDCLSDLGYNVIEATGGAAALAILQECIGKVELLVTDVVMPDLSGEQLAEAAQKLNPVLPVLFISGYPRDVVLQDGRVKAGVELLSKPFTQQALAARVRELLDQVAARI